MNRFLTPLIVAIVSLSALAAQAKSNRELIKTEILGKTFCYTEGVRAGWIMNEDGTAIRHGINLGRPLPGSFYELKFLESLRTYGYFKLINSFEKFDLRINVDQTLYEFGTGKVLSVEACD